MFRKKFNYKVTMMILGAMLVCSNVGTAKYAYATESIEENQEVEQTENEENNIEEETETNEIQGEEAVDNSLPLLEGKGDGYQPITTTTQDEKNTVQMSLFCKMPKYFTLGVKMQILNLDTDEVYEIVATKANNYYGKLYVPSGSYTIASVMVDGDITNKYPMVYPEDFTVYEASNHSIETTLVNYDEIQKEAYDRMGLDENGNKKVAENSYNETVEEEDVMHDGSILPWRIVNHEGEGKGRVTISGTANGVYNIVAEITTSGMGKNAEYKYSTDGGTTWSDVRIVSSTALSNTKDAKTTGLKLNFDSNDEYVAGDRYTYSSAYEYESKVETTINGEGTIRITTDGPIYDKDRQLRVIITQTGKQGEARFKYNLDGNVVEDLIVPEEGFYSIPNTNISITFWDAGSKFVVGDNWYSLMESAKSEKDYTPFIIGGSIICIAGMMGFIYYMQSLKEKPVDYTLRPYTKIDVERPVKKEGKKKTKKTKGKE